MVDRYTIFCHERLYIRKAGSITSKAIYFSFANNDYINPEMRRKSEAFVFLKDDVIVIALGKSEMFSLRDVTEWTNFNI